jgi:hypothetical protein
MLTHTSVPKRLQTYILTYLKRKGSCIVLTYPLTYIHTILLIYIFAYLQTYILTMFEMLATLMRSMFKGIREMLPHQLSG